MEIHQLTLGINTKKKKKKKKKKNKGRFLSSSYIELLWCCAGASDAWLNCRKPSFPCKSVSLSSFLLPCRTPYRQTFKFTDSKRSSANQSWIDIFIPLFILSFFLSYLLTYLLWATLKVDQADNIEEEKEGLSHHRPAYFQTNKQLTKKKRKKRRKSRLCCDRWGSLLLLNSSKARCQIMSSSRSNKPTVSIFPTTGTGMNFVWILLKSRPVRGRQVSKSTNKQTNKN